MTKKLLVNQKNHLFKAVKCFIYLTKYNINKPRYCLLLSGTQHTCYSSFWKLMIVIILKDSGSNMSRIKSLQGVLIIYGEMGRKQK